MPTAAETKNRRKSSWMSSTYVAPPGSDALDAPYPRSCTRSTIPAASTAEGSKVTRASDAAYETSASTTPGRPSNVCSSTSAHDEHHMPSTRRVSRRAPAAAAAAALRSCAVRRRGPSRTAESPLAAASPQTRLQPSQQKLRSPIDPSAAGSTPSHRTPDDGQPAQIARLRAHPTGRSGDQHDQ